MASIIISGDSAHLPDATRDWILQSVGRGMHAGLAVCIRLEIEGDDINLRLATAACGGGGRSRQLTRQEQRIVDLWITHKLTTPAYSPQDVADFVADLRRLL